MVFAPVAVVDGGVDGGVDVGVDVDVDENEGEDEVVVRDIADDEEEEGSSEDVDAKGRFLRSG